MPGVINAIADHRLRNAIFMGGVTKSKTPFYTGVPLVGLAILMGRHTHHRIAFHLCTKGAAHSAVGTGGYHGVIWHTQVYHGVFRQRRRGTGADAGTAGYTFGIHKGLGLAGTHLGLKAAAIYGQGKRALHFVTGSHTARTNNALGRIKGEIRIGGVFLGIQVISPRVTVTHLSQPHFPGRVL